MTTHIYSVALSLLKGLISKIMILVHSVFMVRPFDKLRTSPRTAEIHFFLNYIQTLRKKTRKNWKWYLIFMHVYNS